MMPSPTENLQARPASIPEVRAAHAAIACSTPLRSASRQTLPAAWSALRQRLQAVWQAYEDALPSNLEIRYAPELNPPLWELGHVGWFEEFWIARNPQRLRGVAADPDAPRAASRLTNPEGLYHSSRVAHTRRWHLDLPDGRRTWHALAAIRELTLALLDGTDDSDEQLYFYRLAAQHEAMHLEAWVYMAQHLAIDLRGAGLVLQPEAAPEPTQELSVPAQDLRLDAQGPGFAYDNECPAFTVTTGPTLIDSAPVTWGRFMPFMEAGGYADARWWSEAGWAWRQRIDLRKPRHLSQEDGVWRRAVHGQWVALAADEPAVHISHHEAQAWCRWAGRRLPTEAEWLAASALPGFHWGQVWEWTSSPFAPFPGFEAHPYRDYSQPWFDGRPVLRGASFATWPGVRDARYRNFFPPERQDIFAGFRTCPA
jgi:ergothioneine biosynthesis protein EgtB